MELPKILISGKFKPEDLIVSVSPSNRKIDPAVEAQIETVWNEKVKTARILASFAITVFHIGSTHYRRKIARY